MNEVVYIIYKNHVQLIKELEPVIDQAPPEELKLYQSIVRANNALDISAPHYRERLLNETTH